MTAQIPAHLLTIVMPNYNYARYVADAIDSVIRQTYQPIELIVVDDGSTDNSLEIIEQSLARADKLFHTQVIAIGKNVGKLGAINLALGKIRGDYCIILDSDDRLLPDYAAKCIAALTAARKEQSRVAFVYTDCNLINAQGQAIDRGKSAPFDPLLLEQFSYIPEPAVVLSKAVIEAGPFDESIKRGTKHHKWRRIVANGWRGVHLPEPLFCYRMHDSNLSGIGKRITTEVESGQQGERILSGYWPTEVH
jgi:glycosyltransferase involved in cell wall biosynthesis